jgi:hypothetical protein
LNFSEYVDEFEAVLLAEIEIVGVVCRREFDGSSDEVLVVVSIGNGGHEAGGICKERKRMLLVLVLVLLVEEERFLQAETKPISHWQAHFTQLRCCLL